MDRRLWAVILLVSLAHGLVHVFELVYPTLAISLKTQWQLTETDVGVLANIWALPFGLSAIAAGWLTDRVGAKKILITYLMGASLCCLAVRFCDSYTQVAIIFFLMGSFAGLYHPAGLAYLSHTVPPRRLGQALGWHGILGSLGIASAPLIAGLALQLGSWTWGYLVLVPLGVGVASLMLLLPADQSHSSTSPTPSSASPRDDSPIENPDQTPTDHPAPPSGIAWKPFILLCLTVTLFGLIYRGILTFLPTYLEAWAHQNHWLTQLFGGSYPSKADQSGAGLATSLVLFAGIVGQYSSGGLTKHYRLIDLFVVIILVNIPITALLAWSAGSSRLAVAAIWAVVYFALQPVQNSLVARYSPPQQRSFAYGISFLLSFGVGSFGGSLTGWLATHFSMQQAFGVLAGLAGLGLLLALALRNNPQFDTLHRLDV